MDAPANAHEGFDRFRFGPFEVSGHRAEITKDGARIDLPVESLRVLLLLLKHAGKVVTVAQFSEIWEGSSGVDIDFRLHAALNKLRVVLDCNGSRPPMVEKVPGCGYRFIVPVSVSREPTQNAAGSKSITPVGIHKGPERPAAGSAPANLQPRTSLRSPLVTTLLVAGLFVGVMLLPPQSKDHHAGPNTSRKIVPLTTYLGIETNPAISPDGKSVSFAWTGPRSTDPFSIYVKRIGDEEPQRVTQPPQGASDRAPVWTPDGQQILFHRRMPQGSGIYLTSLSGGDAHQLTATNLSKVDVRHVRFDISPDGRTVVYADRPAGDERRAIFLLDVATSQVKQLTFPEKGSAGDMDPVFSPDGRSIAFGHDALDLQQIYVVPTAGGTPRRITSGNKDQVEGLAWTSDGEAILIGGTELRQVSVGKRDNVISPLPSPPGPVDSPSLRDGKLAYVQEGFTANIWSLELDGPKRAIGQPKLLISSTRQQAAPSISPDGSAIVFQSDRSGSWEIWKSDRDGSNPVQLTSFKGPLTGTPRWSPDGWQIAFDSRVDGSAEIYVISPEGGRPRALTTGEGNSAIPAWSRDGEWIYFSSNRSGRMEIWKMASTGGAAQQLTRDGGTYAAESADGQYVYYSKGPIDSTLWRVPSAGGTEEKVASAPLPDGCSHWALGSHGIYIIDRQGDLVYFDLTNRQTTKLAHHPEFRTDWSMAISSDERTVLWVQIDSARSDLMLAENFHTN